MISSNMRGFVSWLRMGLGNLGLLDVRGTPTILGTKSVSIGVEGGTIQTTGLIGIR
jgi:hypothetical protein